MIVPDRPGFGLSDFQEDRTYLDWPEDVRELADQLGIDRFAVLGCAVEVPPTHVTLSGSGSATVSVRDRLSVVITGSGSPITSVIPSSRAPSPVRVG